MGRLEIFKKKKKLEIPSEQFMQRWAQSLQVSHSILSDSLSPSSALLLSPSIVFFRSVIVFFSSVTSILFQFSSVQSLSRVRLFATPWIAAHQASLSITNSWSSLRLMSIKSVMPSSHLILCHPLLPLPPIPPSIKVFSNESTLRMRWPKYWSEFQL